MTTEIKINKKQLFGRRDYSDYGVEDQTPKETDYTILAETKSQRKDTHYVM